MKDKKRRAYSAFFMMIYLGLTVFYLNKNPFYSIVLLEIGLLFAIIVDGFNNMLEYKKRSKK